MIHSVQTSNIYFAATLILTCLTIFSNSIVNPQHDSSGNGSTKNLLSELSLTDQALHGLYKRNAESKIASTMPAEFIEDASTEPEQALELPNQSTDIPQCQSIVSLAKTRSRLYTQTSDAHFIAADSLNGENYAYSDFQKLGYLSTSPNGETAETTKYVDQYSDHRKSLALAFSAMVISESLEADWE